MIINDLDDFILPSQVCVNPLVGTNTPSGSTVRLDMSTDLSSLEYESDARPVAGSGVIKTKTKDEVKIASISLSDCLACR